MSNYITIIIFTCKLLINLVIMAIDVEVQLIIQKLLMTYLKGGL